MMERANCRYALMLLLLVLSQGAGASPSTTSPRVEPNDSFSPASLFARALNAVAVKTPDMSASLPKDITQKLWRSRVSAPEQTDDTQNQADLSVLVHKIRSVKFEAKEQKPSAASFTMPEPADNRTEPAPGTEATEPQPAQPAITAPAAPKAPLSDETAKALKRVLADPNQASEPLELAELLYLTGRLSEAAILYQKALDSITGKEPASREDQAWILLQLGNCLRESNPARARGMYTRVVAEHADCPWVELAKAHSQLISWYEQVQPRQWLAGAEMPPARQVAASRKPQP
jgi:tetratricopeptide (TPR) repeat protein